MQGEDCTICHEPTLSSAVPHPLLGVKCCKPCASYYHHNASLSWPCDRDGSQKWCSWCFDGGEMICCSRCPRVFCLECISNNLPPKYTQKCRQIDCWLCLVCDPSALAPLLCRQKGLSRTGPTAPANKNNTNGRQASRRRTGCISSPVRKRRAGDRSEHRSSPKSRNAREDPVKTDNVQDEEVFEVEAIVDKREIPQKKGLGSQVEYLIKWKVRNTFTLDMSSVPHKHASLSDVLMK